MSDRLFERAVHEWLEEGSDRTPPAAIDAVLFAVKTTPQQRDLRVLRRFMLMPTYLRLAASIVIVALIGVSGILAQRAIQQGATPSPTTTAAVPMVWTPSANERSWPGAIRHEPQSSPELFQVADFVDPAGDSGSQDGWTDLSKVTLRGGVAVGSVIPIGLELVGGLLLVPDPGTTWIAYGVVIDLDGDGRADQRIGIDNGVPGREWITDLKTGQTAVNLTSESGAFGAFGTRLETWFVDADGQVTLHVKRTNSGIRFYAWASTIAGGRIVSTDFAPDVGWIQTVFR